MLAMYTHDASEAADAGKVGILMEAPVTTPIKSLLALEDTVIDQVASPAGYFSMEEARDFRLGPVVARIDGGTIIFPWQQFALSIIQNSIDDRPIYFASSGNAARSLGLSPYLVRQGVAFKLNPGPPDLSPENVLMDDPSLVPVTGPWLDDSRTRTLVDEVFMHRGGIPDGWMHWPDRSTIGIPYYYTWAYAALVQSALQAGDPDGAAPYEERLVAWQTLAQ